MKLITQPQSLKDLFRSLWHERMGHIREKGLRAMKKKGMVEFFPECGLEVDFCEHCIYGKQSRVSFPSGVTRDNGTHWRKRISSYA